MCLQFFFGLFCPVTLSEKAFARKWSKEQWIQFVMTYLQAYINRATGSKWAEAEEHQKLNLFVQKAFLIKAKYTSLLRCFPDE